MLCVIIAIYGSYNFLSNIIVEHCIMAFEYQYVDRFKICTCRIGFIGCTQLFSFKWISMDGARINGNK